MESLGLIEVKGLVSAIEAADSAMKAANVELLGKDNVGAGLISVILKGEIGAIKAAVEAGADAAKKVGEVVSTLVKDVSIRMLPVLRRDVEEMIMTTKAYRVLQGLRGKPPADMACLVEVILNVAKFVEQFPLEVAELDLNPLIVYQEGQGVIAVDALLTVN